MNELFKLLQENDIQIMLEYKNGGIRTVLYKKHFVFDGFKCEEFDFRDLMIDEANMMNCHYLYFVEFKKCLQKLLEEI